MSESSQPTVYQKDIAEQFDDLAAQQDADILYRWYLPHLFGEDFQIALQANTLVLSSLRRFEGYFDINIASLPQHPMYPDDEVIGFNAFTQASQVDGGVEIGIDILTRGALRTVDYKIVENLGKRTLKVVSVSGPEHEQDMITEATNKQMRDFIFSTLTALAVPDQKLITYRFIDQDADERGLLREKGGWYHGMIANRIIQGTREDAFKFRGEPAFACVPYYLLHNLAYTPPLPKRKTE